ncbi:MAG: DUF3037 domain-containing protein [Terriglobales bacterium]
MAERKQLDLFLLRYVTNAVRGEFVNIGLIMIEDDPVGFADARFVPDWRAVERVDPEADIEMLQTMKRYILEQMRDPAARQLMLKKMEDSFSNSIQISPKSGCVTEDPAKTIEDLASLYFKAVHAAPQKVQSGRNRIWQKMRTAFDEQGVLKALIVDAPMAKYTKPGDPLKLDFGYYVEPTLKFFHAVSLKANVSQAITLGSRFPQIAAGITRETDATPLLTAVVDDDLDRSRPEIGFALAMLSDNQVQIAVAGDILKIAERARRELTL